MNLSIITTLGSNSGDNFIYEGFKNIFPEKYFQTIFLIDKTLIPKNDNFKEFIDNSDLIVICGSPIFYKDCYKMKWQNQILEYSKATEKRILLFAVGSNFKCSVDGTIDFPDVISDKKYIDFIMKYCDVLYGNFIVRDRYAVDFLKTCGITDVYQTVCPSFFAGEIDPNRKDRDLIFIIWGSTFWNCDIPKQKIFSISKGVYNSLSRMLPDKRCLWVCHDLNSYKELLEHFDRKDILFSNNYIDFLKYYSRCFFGFSVKVHGSMLLSSMGIPSLLLKLDSRASVIEALGDSYVTADMQIEQLVKICIERIESAGNYKEKIIELKTKYRKDYSHLFNRMGFEL